MTAEDFAKSLGATVDSEPAVDESDPVKFAESLGAQVEGTGQGRLESSIMEAGKSFGKVFTNTATGLMRAIDNPLLGGGSKAVRFGMEGGSRLIGKPLPDPATNLLEEVRPGLSQIVQRPSESAAGVIEPIINRTADALLPTNPIYGEEWGASKIPSVVGQATGQLATSLLPAKWAGAGSNAMRALGLSQAGLMGLSGAAEEADRLGIKDPVKRDVFTTLMAGIESGSEAIGGLGGKSFSKALSGEIRDILEGNAIKNFLKTAGSEGIEEVVAKVPQDIASTVMRENEAPVDTINPTKLDYWANLGEAFGLGTIGGAVFGGAQAVMNRKTPSAAMAMRAAVQDHLNDFNGKTPTEAEAVELQELQDYDAKLSAWLAEKGVTPAQQKAGLATATAISSATRAGLPGAANALREAARISAQRQGGAFASREPAPVVEETSVVDDLISQEAASLPEQQARAAQPLIHSGEDEDTVYQDGQWVNAMGQPSPKSAELEAIRQQYIATGQLGEGLQLYATAQESVEAVAQPEAPVQELTPIAPETVVQEQPVVAPPTNEVVTLEDQQEPTPEGAGQSTIQAVVGESTQGAGEVLGPSGSVASTDEISATPEGLQEGVPAEANLGPAKVIPEPPPIPQPPPLTIDQIVSKLEASSRVPGLKPSALAAEVQQLAGGRVPELAQALGYKASPKDIAVQMLMEAQNARRQGRAGDVMTIEEREAKPIPDEVSSEGIGERAMTLEERIEKRGKGGEDAPVGMRPQDLEGRVQSSMAKTEVPERPRANVAFNLWQEMDAMDARLQAEALDDAWRSFYTAGKSYDKSDEQLAQEWAQELSDPESPVVFQGVVEAKRVRKNRDYTPEEVVREGTSEPNQGDDTGVQFSKPRGKPLIRGVTPANVESAIKGLRALLPNIRNAWTGTRSQLADHLKQDAAFRDEWKRQWMAVNPGSTNAQAETQLNDWIASSLNGQEGFTFNGRTYLISDQVAVYEGESPAQAARRVLVHEDAHEGLNHMRRHDPDIEKRWKELRAEIPAEELDDLAKTLYPWLKDWRNSERTWDSISDEWLAAKIAQIETRGQPEPSSLIGRFVKWLKYVWKKLFGSDMDPTDQALLDFMDATRDARFRDMAQAQARGVRYSASDPTGGDDQTPERFFENQNPESRRDYDLWGKERVEKLEEFNIVNPSLGKDATYFTEFLGEPTDESRLRQQWRPMIDFAKSKIGGVHGQLPELTQENTENAMALAREMLTKEEFTNKLRRDFQSANPMHGGDAIGSIMQLELIDYGKRMLAKNGDARLVNALMPVVNDTIVGAYLNMSAVGRTLGSRALVNKDNGYFTAIRLANGAQQDMAEKAAGGEKNLEEIVVATRGEAVAREFVEGLEYDASEAQAEIDKNAEQFEEESWRDAALEVLDAEEKALVLQYETYLREIGEMAFVLREMESKAANMAQPSMAEVRAKYPDVETLKKAMAEKIALWKEVAQKLVQKDTSSEGKDVRRKRSRATPEAKAARAVLTADAQAKKMLERYEERNKRVKREKPEWRKTFEEQVRRPRTPEEFVAEMQRQGLSPEVSQRLFETAGQITQERLNKLAQKATEPAKPKGAPTGKKISPTAFLSSVVRQILDSPLNKQKVLRPLQSDKDSTTKSVDGIGQGWNPQWVEDVFTNAFVKQGVPVDRARELAKRLAPKAVEILKAAQEKAAGIAAKKLKLAEPKAKAIREAIRAGARDPSNSNSVVQGLAHSEGFQPLAQEQFQRLAQLDEDMNAGSPTLTALASSEMTRILSKVRPDKKWWQMIDQIFVNGALSSMGVMNLNWTHPPYILLRKLMTDIIGLGYDTATGRAKAGRFENAKLIKETFNSLWDARRNFYQQAKFSIKNDAYQNRQQEYLNAEHQLYKELMSSLDQMANFKNNPAKALWGAVKTVWLSSDWVRRILATADQTWGSAIQNYVIRNEAMRELVQRVGMTVEQAALIVSQAKDVGDGEQAKQLINGRNKNVSTLMGWDAYKKSIAEKLSEQVWRVDPSAKNAGDQLTATTEKESLMELGNRRSEESPSWDVFNSILEGVKTATSSFRNKVPLLGRPITGFVSVGANLLNRSIYLTPLGFARVWAKLKHSQREGFYKETMGTDAQVRMRLHEAITSTIAMAILAALRYDKEDKQEGMVITGDGPENRGVREAWMKKGHRPGHVEFRDGEGKVMVSIPYTRGGMDHIAVALTSMGALDDLELDGKTPDEGGLQYGWDFATTWGSNQVRQAQFFALKAIVGAAPSSDKPEAMARWLGYASNPFTPWGGLTKSIGKMFSGQQDESSMRAAVLSQLPVMQPIFGAPGPKLNSLGDPVGIQPESVWKKISERASFAGLPIFFAFDPEPKDEPLYALILEKGYAPSVPLRSELESRNGWLPDEDWADYVQTRGEKIKMMMRANLPKLQRLSPEEAQELMEDFSREASKSTKKMLGLK